MLYPKYHYSLEWVMVLQSGVQVVIHAVIIPLLMYVAPPMTHKKHDIIQNSDIHRYCGWKVPCK